MVSRLFLTIALLLAHSTLPGVAQVTREGHHESHGGDGQHQQGQHHHSWGFFYENMCGCVVTRNEGCGLSSQQLYKTLTESYGLQQCERQGTDGLEPAVAERVKAECDARRHLRDVALEFQACSGYRSDICQQHQDTCEWEAQDVESCGIDEEKLLAKLLGKEMQHHPLMRNVLAADKCSTYSYQGCLGDEQCSWSRHSQMCRVHSWVTFQSFVEHPALFEVLAYAKAGAQCRGWHEHVWHGDVCYEQDCQLEGGLCGSKHSRLDSLKANSTVVKAMMDSLCWQSYQQTAACQQGCVFSNERQACIAEDLKDSVNLELTEDDRKVALYYMVLRSATYIHEIRCNSLDNDMQQCNQTFTQHPSCGENEFHPNATEVFGRWQSYGGGGHGHGGQATTKEEIRRQVMNNTIKNLPKADAGIGFNGAFGDIMGNATEANRTGFLEVFQQFLNQPETVSAAKMLMETAQQIAEISRGQASVQQPLPPAHVEPEHKKEDHESMMTIYLACIACLVLAAVCGGYAGGVLCGSHAVYRNTRLDRSPLLQMSAHQGPDGLVNI